MRNAQKDKKKKKNDLGSLNFSVQIQRVGTKERKIREMLESVSISGSFFAMIFIELVHSTSVLSLKCRIESALRSILMKLLRRTFS